MIRLAKNCARLLYRIGVPLPHAVVERVVRMERYESSKRTLTSIFEGRKMTMDKRGFWSVEPMPASDELDRYYAESYWAVRNDQPIWLRHRDIAHFQQLQQYLQQMVGGAQKPVALNFGAGHGGISFLLVAAGFEVVNFDPYPSDLPIFGYASDIEQVPFGCSLVYGSHSFEHITDVDATFTAVIDRLRPGGLLFAEVPNATYMGYSEVGKEGHREPKIHPPHTVYFTSDFFRSLPMSTMELDTFVYEGNPWGVAALGEGGEVIRFIGRKPLQNAVI